MFITVGLPGAGKTSLLTKIKESGYDVINYGDVMFELARERYKNLIKTRDDMRKLKHDEYVKLQAETAVLISKKAGPKTIIDTHAVIFTVDGYLPGLPLHILKEFKNVSHIILITAPYEDIKKRRERDSEMNIRKREVLKSEKFSKDEFARQSELTFNLVSVYAFFTGAHVVIIENPEGKLDEAAANFKKLIENV